MNLGSRFVFVVAAGGLATAANAFTYYNLSSGDLGLVGQSNGQFLTVGGPAIGAQSDTTNGLIDFTPGAPGLAAGDSTGVGFRSYSFTYQVNAPGQIDGVGIVLLGTIGGAGKITFEEDIFRVNADNSETQVAMISNTLLDGSTGSEDGTYHQSGANYTFTDNTRFGHTLDRYKVKKSFFLEVTDWGTDRFNAKKDFASIGLIEQNHHYPTPEPATLATLALGAITLITRRRRIK